jgi:ATP/maltotriose-dependent transcriptional regulator MalT
MPPQVDERQAGSLLERDAQLAGLDELLSGVVASGRGRVVLIGGEAGVGKTALLREFCERRPQSVRLAWGACDALFTPRPLGPLFEVAEGLGGDLEELVGSGARAHEVSAALLGELDTTKGAVLVLEDLHWADEATLDVLRLVARRVESSRTLVLGSYRDDELDRTHPLRIVLGELAPVRAVTRMKLDPLSPAAVAHFAETSAVDPEDLYRRTAGNPFFVSEVLAGAAGDIPETVRDAVLARAARLDLEARTLLEAAAVATPQAELWLLEALAPDEMDRVEDCLVSGMLTATHGGVAFRHELARLAIEQSLTPDRARELNRRALAALAAPPAGVPDLARLSHHAEAAGDEAAVLRFAPQAAARAASLGAHREAAAQYERALRFAEGEPPAARAELLELRSHECYLSGQLDRALAAQEQAVAYRRELGDKLREGDSLRSLARLLGFGGRTEEAERACLEAIDLLEQLEPGPELARAYGKMAQRRMNWDDAAGALEWGNRALELAERVDASETYVYALCTVGVAERLRGSTDAPGKLERSLELARNTGLDDDAGRAYLNLAWSSIRQLRLTDAERYLAEGLDFTDERGLGYWWLCLLALQASLRLMTGEWDAAAEGAAFALADPRRPRVSQIIALWVQGLVRARRGDPDAWPSLDEAIRLAEATGELQQIAPVVTARAEAAWLDGRPEKVAGELQSALAVALRFDSVWEVGRLACWCERLGVETDLPRQLPESPYALELAGNPDGAAQLWEESGCTYDAALARSGSDDADTLRQTLEELQRAEARPAAAIVSRRLRELGARGLPRGPRPATRANAANLTPRQLEVLALLSDGLRNVDIAERLFLSEKTVDHHVSAILSKLDARTRGEASAKAIRLGILTQDP